MRPLLLAVALCAIGAPQLAWSEPAGRWSGHWVRAGDTLDVVLHITRDDSTGGLRGAFDSEPLRVAGIPLTAVRLSGCCALSFRIVGDATTAEHQGTLSGDRLTGTFTEDGAPPGTFAFVRSEAPPLIEERSVTFSAPGAKLAGSLLLPRTRSRVPAMVFVHGAGAEGRWASRFLAGHLAESGIAALIYDKRGVGSSTGDWRVARPEDLVNDALAAIAFLRAHRRIDSARVGLHGHSQGGTLAPMIAARSGAVACVIGSASAAAPFDSTEMFSVFNSVRDRVTPGDSATAAGYIREIVAVAFHGADRRRLDSLATVYAGRPWFIPLPPVEHHYWAWSGRVAEYQPLQWWKQVRVPVLLLYGSGDERVPAESSAMRIASTLRAAGNENVDVRVFPGADHTFRLPAGPGGWAETDPAYMPSLIMWTRATLMRD